MKSVQHVDNSKCQNRQNIIDGTVLAFYYPLKPQWSLCVPPGLTFNSSTFCPHNLFMCFLWI